MTHRWCEIQQIAYITNNLFPPNSKMWQNMVGCKNSSPQNYKFFTHPFVIFKLKVIYDEIYDV